MERTHPRSILHRGTRVSIQPLLIPCFVCVGVISCSVLHCTTFTAVLCSELQCVVSALQCGCIRGACGTCNALECVGVPLRSASVHSEARGLVVWFLWVLWKQDKTRKFFVGAVETRHDHTGQFCFVVHWGRSPTWKDLYKILSQQHTRQIYRHNTQTNSFV